MELDPLLLSRIQFAFVIAFHILFPAFTIGLASFIALLEIRWLIGRDDFFLRLSKFWTRIFAISFGMGVVSGIVMSYQFGTNWAQFSVRTANVLGPLLSYEVQTAFFLEATFLGILLFGRGKVPHPVVTLSAVMVAFGTLVSAFWILSANSWMHTPAGFEMRDGVVHVTSWWDAVFNPSFPYRLAHMVVACFVTTGFAVAGASAWHLLRGHSTAAARHTLSMTLWLLAALVPAQILIGDLHGLNTLEHQPAKIAAMEGHWETRQGAALVLFALPDMAAEENRFELAIPKLGSLILTHDPDGAVRGLKSWPAADRPYVPLVFWSFRVMVGCGLLMLALVLWSLYLRMRGRLFNSALFLRACLACTPLGFVAVLAGWFTTETGRQPWLVQGVIRTAEGLSPALPGSSVLLSLILYAVAYAIIFGAGIVFILRTVREGPE
jgi:cytochrome d ubiquinol oxidase subunit I